MIKLIVGKKGTGKTKQLIDMMNDSVAKVNGNIVCIEEGMESTFNVNSNIRLIDIDEYKIDFMIDFTVSLPVFWQATMTSNRFTLTV